jgi:hypothetical protein
VQPPSLRISLAGAHVLEDFVDTLNESLVVGMVYRQNFAGLPDIFASKYFYGIANVNFHDLNLSNFANQR